MFIDLLLRNFMSKNCNCYMYTKFVVRSIAKKFNLNYDIKIEKNYFLIKIGEYEIIYDDPTSSILQPCGWFAVDMLILSEMQKQGFILDKNKYF